MQGTPLAGGDAVSGVMSSARHSRVSSAKKRPSNLADNIQDITLRDVEDLQGAGAMLFAGKQFQNDLLDDVLAPINENDDLDFNFSVEVPSQSFQQQDESSVEMEVGRRASVEMDVPNISLDGNEMAAKVNNFDDAENSAQFEDDANRLSIGADNQSMQLGGNSLEFDDSIQDENVMLPVNMQASPKRQGAKVTAKQQNNKKRQRKSISQLAVKCQVVDEVQTYGNNLPKIDVETGKKLFFLRALMKDSAGVALERSSLFGALPLLSRNTAQFNILLPQLHIQDPVVKSSVSSININRQDSNEIGDAPASVDAQFQNSFAADHSFIADDPSMILNDMSRNMGPEMESSFRQSFGGMNDIPFEASLMQNENNELEQVMAVRNDYEQENQPLSQQSTQNMSLMSILEGKDKISFNDIVKKVFYR